MPISSTILSEFQGQSFTWPKQKTSASQILSLCIRINPLPDDNILDWSKLKQFADDNFKFDENNRRFSKRVENTVGKGEIARYKQFLLFPECFQKACFPGASKGVIVWEWVKTIPLTSMNSDYRQNKYDLVWDHPGT